MSYKTDNKIFTDIKAVLDGFLATLTGQSGWKVIQANQPIPVGINDKMILLSRVYSTRVGWQGSTETDNEGNRKHIEHWREELRLQVSFFSQRNPATDTVETWSAIDMAKRMMAYLDSFSGVRALFAKGYSKLRYESIRLASFVNDSKKYQFNPGFDLVLLHTQSVENATDWVYPGNVETAPI